MRIRTVLRRSSNASMAAALPPTFVAMVTKIVVTALTKPLDTVRIIAVFMISSMLSSNWISAYCRSSTPVIYQTNRVVYVPSGGTALLSAIIDEIPQNHKVSQDDRGLEPFIAVCLVFPTFAAGGSSWYETPKLLASPCLRRGSFEHHICIIKIVCADCKRNI